MGDEERPDNGEVTGEGGASDFQGLDPESQETAKSSSQVLPQNYRSCLDAIPDLMCLKGEELEYLFVNKAFCEFLGMPQDQILGKRSIHVFPKEVARKLETMDLLVLASTKKAEEEVKIYDRLWEIRKFPVSLQDRGLIVVNGRDITERKDAEKTLLTEKIRFQILSDNAIVGMLLLDSDGSIKYLNARFKDIFGYEADDITDGATWFRRVFPGRDYESDIRSVLTHAEEVRGWKEKDRRTLTAICRDGTQKMVSLEAVQLASGDIVVSCDDVAERAISDNKTVSRVDLDALTGLPNRLSMERAVKIAVDHAREARKRRSLGAALFIDVEEYESLTEKHGRFSTDEVLVSFARMLKTILRLGDSAYRLSGSQFGVIFKGISLAEASLAASRIHTTLNAIGFQIGAEKVRLDLAIVLLPINGKDESADLFSIAAKTMEHSKTLGRNQIVVHKSPTEKAEA